jgi:hypothetical protein
MIVPYPSSFQVDKVELGEARVKGIEEGAGYDRSL